MRINIFLILSVFLFSSLGAQNNKRAFKSLEKGEYDKAEEQFVKVITEDPENAAANLGMALIYADDKSPKYNLVFSWKYVERLQKNINNLSQDDIEIVAEYFNNTEVRKSSRPVKKKIEYAVSTIQDKLIKYIREENNLEIAYAVLNNYPDFPHYNNVVHIRNQLEFRKYEKQNTLAGFQEFLKKFPDAAQVDKANRYIDKLEFEEVKTKNTVEAYNEYMKNHPKAEQYQTALRLRNAAAFKLARQVHTMLAYEKFILSYPKALEVAEAKKYQKELLYEHAKRVKTLEAYNEFIRKYPDGQQYFDIFNIKSLDLGMKFAGTISGLTSNIAWARSFDHNQNFENAFAVTVNSKNEYILAGSTAAPDTNFQDVWVLKLSTDGKMIWNKFFRQSFRDKILSAKCNSRDEIIFAGHTHLTSDPASRTGWIFKMDTEGNIIWNRNFDLIEFASLAINKDDNILLGGYHVSDSMEVNMALTILNDEGRKIWSRNYLNSGSLNSICMAENDDLILAAGNWIIKTDKKGYIKWESTLPQGDSILEFVSDDKNIFFVAARDNITRVLYQYSQSGTNLGTKVLPVANKAAISSGILPNGNLMVVTQNENNSEFDFFGAGLNLTDSRKVVTTGTFKMLTKDKLNNILLLFSNGDITLVKSFGSNL